MRSLSRVAECLFIALQLGHELLVRSVVSGRNHYEGMDLLAVIALGRKFGEGIYEDVNALVPIFIATAYAHEDRVLRDLGAGHGGSRLAEGFPRDASGLKKFFFGIRSDTVLEAVRSHHIDLSAEKMGTFPGSDFTDGGEDIGIVRGSLLHGMSGHDTEPLCRLLRFVGLELVIERLVVPRKAAAEYGRMGGEDGRDRKSGLLEIKYAGACLPLVELGHDLVRRFYIIFAETLDYHSGHPAEKNILFVVPVSGDGIHLVSLPKLAENFVDVGKELLVVHQNGYRFSRDIPVSYPESEALRSGLLVPGSEESRVLDEVRVRIGVHPDVRSDEDMASLALGHQI